MTPLAAALSFVLPLLAGTAEFPEEELSAAPLLSAESGPSEPKLTPAARLTGPDLESADEQPTRRLPALIVMGPVTLGVGYAAALVGLFASIRCGGGFYSSVRCSSGSAYLLIPLVGPWAALADSAATPPMQSLLVADGLFQAMGLATIIASIFIKVPDDSEPSAHLSAPAAGSWSLAAGAAGTPYGLTFDIRLP